VVGPDVISAKGPTPAELYHTSDDRAQQLPGVASRYNWHKARIRTAVLKIQPPKVHHARSEPWEDNLLEGTPHLLSMILL